jgi:hypothetical protein
VCLERSSCSSSGGVARAQSFCTESSRCTYTVGSPGRFATIVPHRLLFASGELVWASAVDVHALDLGTGRTRTLPHCGTAITDLALEGSYVYVLADHQVLCRVSVSSSPASVQMLVNSPNTIIDGFAVSSAGFAYAMRRPGGQPGVHVAEWSTGLWRTFATQVTVEHLVVDATRVYWIDIDTLVTASLATGQKSVGPRLANRVTRLQVTHGIVYAATDHDVVRLDSAGMWITVAAGRADDLAVDGTSVYAASMSRGTVQKIGSTTTRIGSWNKPYAIAVDATSLFVVEDDPFVIKQVLPR